MSAIHTAIQIDRWGKDHWSTLAYVEARVVDHGGKLNADQMRCSRDRHPQAYGAKRRSTAFGTDADGTKFPTRLNDGTEVFGHDDYDCLADMVSEGLITELQDLLLERPSDVEGAGDPNAVWRLTPRGEAAVAALRAHKGRGGNFRTFTFTEATS